MSTPRDAIDELQLRHRLDDRAIAYRWTNASTVELQLRTRADVAPRLALELTLARYGHAQLIGVRRAGANRFERGRPADWCRIAQAPATIALVAEAHTRQPSLAERLPAGALAHYGWESPAALHARGRTALAHIAGYAAREGLWNTWTLCDDMERSQYRLGGEGGTVIPDLEAPGYAASLVKLAVEDDSATRRLEGQALEQTLRNHHAARERIASIRIDFEECVGGLVVVAKPVLWQRGH